MLYYRYRPSGELPLKELLYDELFLSTAAECNDPFDGASFLAFGPDATRWGNLLKHAWREARFPKKESVIQALAKTLSSEAPLSFRAAESQLPTLVRGCVDLPDPHFADALASVVSTFLALYEPRRPYFSSFTTVANSTLMWAHYGAMHEGHCLIFRPLDGSLRQCPHRRRRSINRRGMGGLAPSMSSEVPEGFKFENVHYETRTQALDAFMHFPQAVSSAKLSEAERLSLNRDLRRQSFTKHSCWSYEQEVRITLDPPIPWLFGGNIALTPLERLFHFMPTQLVGVILGARTSEARRERIREICLARSNRLSHQTQDFGHYLDFVLFQAQLTHDDRGVAIEPTEIMSLGSTTSKDSADFPKKLKSWENGEGLFFHGNGAKRMLFL